MLYIDTYKKFTITHFQRAILLFLLLLLFYIYVCVECLKTQLISNTKTPEKKKQFKFKYAHHLNDNRVGVWVSV